MNRKRLITTLLLTIIVGTALYTNQVSAYGYGSDHSVMIQRLAQAFGKTDAEVEEVFANIQEEHHKERQAEIAIKLDQAVTNGIITTEQKSLIEARHEEMFREHDTFFANKDNMTHGEWRASRQNHHEEMEGWAEDNGIDLEALNFGQQRGRGHGMHRAYMN